MRLKNTSSDCRQTIIHQIVYISNKEHKWCLEQVLFTNTYTTSSLLQYYTTNWTGAPLLPFVKLLKWIIIWQLNFTIQNNEKQTKIIRCNLCKTQKRDTLADISFIRCKHPENWTKHDKWEDRPKKWSSFRPISTAKLNISLCLHTQPINLVVYKGSLELKSHGYLILEPASRLDAFSVYPIRT